MSSLKFKIKMTEVLKAMDDMEDDDHHPTTESQPQVSSDEEEELKFDDEEEKKDRRSSKVSRTSFALDDLDDMMAGEAKPVDESVLFDAHRRTSLSNKDNSNEEDSEQEGEQSDIGSTGGRKKRKKVSRKKIKEKQDLEDAVYAQYKRQKEVDDELPTRPLKHIIKYEEIVPKILELLTPTVDSFLR